MTDDEPGSRTVTAGGISVEKSFEDDRFPVPAIRFVIRSDREERTEVRLTDSIPEEIPMEHIGFHPDYESEHWTAYKNHRVRFEHTIEPGEEITTVYGIRDHDGIDPDSFLDEPSIALPDTEETAVGFADDVEAMISETLDENGDRVVDDLLTGDRDLAEVDAVGDTEHPIDLPMEGEDGPAAGVDSGGIDSDPDSGDADFQIETDDDDWANVDPEVEMGLASDPSSSPNPNPNANPVSGADAPPESEPESEIDADSEFEPEPDPDPEAETNDAEMQGSAAKPVVEGDTEALAAGLAAELREGRVDDEVLAILREAIGIRAPESMDVRLKHVQSRIDDLAAYTDALEAFINEHGPQEHLDELESEIESVRQDITTLESEIGSTVDDQGTIEERITELEDDIGDVTSLREQLGDVRSTIDALESTVKANAQELDETDEDLTAIRAELSALSEDISEISAEIEETVAPLTTRLKSLEEDLETVRDDIESLENWRDRVTDVFGSE